MDYISIWLYTVTIRSSLLWFCGSRNYWSQNPYKKMNIGKIYIWRNISRIKNIVCRIWFWGHTYGYGCANYYHKSHTECFCTIIAHNTQVKEHNTPPYALIWGESTSDSIWDQIYSILTLYLVRGMELLAERCKRMCYTITYCIVEVLPLFSALW